jgi:hypothetical protein
LVILIATSELLMSFTVTGPRARRNAPVPSLIAVTVGPELVKLSVKLLASSSEPPRANCPLQVAVSESESSTDD